jgi:hypothetical protein
MNRWLVRTILVIGVALLAPSAVYAQGALAGVVRDTTGAVLPGVTAEASSPALIEKTRSVVTDEQGQYKIVDLPPGTYTITFTLSGFSTLKRENLVLSGQTTLPVNADLKVGQLEETLTVNAESPVVDVQNTRKEAILQRDVLDAIPRNQDAAMTAGLLTGVTVGAVQDMGGSGTGVIAQLVAHGSNGNDQLWNIDGMKAAGNTRRVMVIGDQASQEVTYQLSAVSAETDLGGVVMNVVPKEGGNRFSGQFFGAYTGSGMTSANLSSDLVARGLKAVPTIDYIYDVSPSVGGPIVKDKLWFYATYRKNASNGTYANVFYESDPTKPGPNPNYLWDISSRFTIQADHRDKFNVFLDSQYRYQPFRTSSPTQTPEASAATYYPEMYIIQGRYTAPFTNRLLLEVSGSYYHEHQEFIHSPAWPGPQAYPHFEITTGVYTNAAPASGGLLNPNTDNPMPYTNIVAKLSYVTGTHAFKFGITDYYGTSDNIRTDMLPTLYYNKGLPFQVQLTALPAETLPRLNYDIGMFGQDQWTLKRFTVNAGIRFDFLNEQLDAENVPAGTVISGVTLVPARSFAQVSDVPSWRDVSPRLGLAWDVFGTGKTAIKTSLSRYLGQEIAGFSGSVNALSASTDTRTWNDANKDGIPQLSELGPSTNLNFGLPAIVTFPTDDVRTGWQKRPYNWEYSLSVSHTLFPGLAFDVGYYHRTFRNLTFTQNTLVNPSNFTAFNWTSPLDGSAITSYNLSPALRGQSKNIITFAPDNYIRFNGVDVTLIGKFGHGGIVNGGISMGKTAVGTCEAGLLVDPNSLRFCEVSPDFMAQNTYKFLVSHPLPWDFTASATFQSVPGPVFATPPFPPQPGIAANYALTSAVAGVTLTNGTISVPLVRLGTQFGDRKNQLDFRFGRRFKFANNVVIDPHLDIYNVLNANPVLSENFTFGPLWQQPTDVLIGRVVQIGLQVKF